MKPVPRSSNVAPQRRPAAWRMLSDTATVGGWTVFVKVAGAVKLILCARLFGAGDAMDAYLIAFLLPSFFADVLAGPVDGALIPTLVELRERRGQAAAESTYAAVLAAVAAMLLLLVVVAALASSFLLPFLASSFSPQKLALTRRLLLVMIASAVFSGISSTWRAVLNSGHRFAIAAAIPTIVPLTCVGGLLLGGKQFGITALALATVVGAMVEAIASAAAVRRAGYSLLPKWSGYTPALRQVVEQYRPLVAITLVMTGSAFLDQALAARLTAGSVSALNYGTRLLGVLVAIAPTAAGTAVLPHLSAGALLEQREALRRTLRTYGIFLLAALLPVIGGLMYFSQPIVRILFQQGAFTESATRLVAAVQALSLLQVPAAVLLVLEIRLSSALKENRILYRVAGLTLLLTVVLDTLFMRWWGVAGIVLAGLAVRLVSTVYLSCKISGLPPKTLESRPSIV
ncbi:MAG: lipid II flippase MurJ [Bryobacteraceae bacterium]